MSNTTAVPGHRWATVTPDDRSGILYIAAFLTFTYSSCTFIARGFIKWNVLGLDDGATVIAQIASLTQFGLLIASLSAGLGKTFETLSADEYARMVSYQYGNQIALYLSLGVSKISTILLIKRLFTRDMKNAWKLCQVVTIILTAWTVMTPFLVSVGCSPASLAPTIRSETCSGIILRYKVVVVTDAITDIILVVVPASLCWQLQMSIHLKFQVFAVFAFRLPLIVMTSLAFITWRQSLSGSNPGVERTPAIIYQQSGLCISLIAATIPCLKSFIRSFDTGSGVKATFGYSSNGYGSSARTTNVTQSYKMSDIGRSKVAVSRSESQTRLHMEDEDMQARSRSFTSGRIASSIARSKGMKESDWESQISGNELCIRRDMQFEVTSQEMPR